MPITLQTMIFISAREVARTRKQWAIRLVDYWRRHSDYSERSENDVLV